MKQEQYSPNTTPDNQFAIMTCTDRTQWDQFVLEHPKGTIFHTSLMIDVFRETKNYYPLPLAAINSAGKILALLVAVRVQTLPDPLGGVSSRSMLYAEPLCLESEEGIEALTALIKVHDAKMSNHVLFTEVRPIWAPGVERIALEHCGYIFYEYLNFIADLTQTTETLWNKMIKSCRADIRRSTKRGLTIKEVTTPEGIDLLYKFAQMSYERSRVPLADKSLFTSALSILQPHGMVKVFIAYHEDHPVAADIILFYKQMVFAWYGGLSRIRGISPVECLTWHEIEQGSNLGYHLYDFGGAGQPSIPYGVRDFKAKFGADLVNYGRYRKIYSPWKFYLAEKAYATKQELEKILSEGIKPTITQFPFIMRQTIELLRNPSQHGGLYQTICTIKQMVWETIGKKCMTR